MRDRFILISSSTLPVLKSMTSMWLSVMFSLCLRWQVCRWKPWSLQKNEIHGCIAFCCWTGCCIHPILYCKSVPPLLCFGPSFRFVAPPAANSCRRASVRYRLKSAELLLAPRFPLLVGRNLAEVKDVCSCSVLQCIAWCIKPDTGTKNSARQTIPVVAFWHKPTLLRLIH